VRYEIDGYRERDQPIANGRITGDGALMAEAFAAGRGQLTLACGRVVEIALKVDPHDDDSAEIELKGELPVFPKA
jgi:hypothetical protein